VVWCLTGFAVGFAPEFHALHFNPEIALFIFLPPLVYASAVDLPWPEFRDNLRPIGVLAIGLVLATAAAAAVLVHSMAALPWTYAAVLGAVLSPTDPVAASGVAAGVGMPRRLVAIVEGEGLVNDAVALTLFRLALAAVVAGRFSVASGVTRFAAILIGEPLYGWMLGIVIARLRARIDDPRLEIAVSLLTPFAAYLVPHQLGGSGILATVATGMYIGERSPTLVPAGTRLHATSVWQTFVFLLNGILFLAAGLEVQKVVVASASDRLLLRSGFEAAVAVTAIRFGWCFLSAYVLRALRRLMGYERHRMPLRHLLIVAWSGIRGPISLAAAMSIPAGGGERSLYGEAVSVTAVVVLVTLLLQGLTLSPLIRLSRVSEDVRAESEQQLEEEQRGQSESTQAALARLASLEAEQKVSPQLAERIRRLYRDQLAVHPQAPESDGDESAEILSELLNAERARILSLRNQGQISDQVLSRLERKLDLRQTLLE
jgi:Na+/H+ antiporter